MELKKLKNFRNEVNVSFEHCIFFLERIHLLRLLEQLHLRNMLLSLHFFKLGTHHVELLLQQVDLSMLAID